MGKNAKASNKERGPTEQRNDFVALWEQQISQYHPPSSTFVEATVNIIKLSKKVTEQEPHIRAGLVGVQDSYKRLLRE